MNDRLQFEALLNGHQGQSSVVLPILGGFAASVCQMTLDDMWGDPMCLARCLEDAHALTGGPALCGGFDLTLLAEALGCTLAESANGIRQVAHVGAAGLPEVGASDLLRRGRLPALLTAWDRLKVTAANVSRIGIVPGVATVTAQLAQAGLSRDEAGKRVGSAARTLVRALLERGVHHILLAENRLPADHTKELTDDYRSISTMVRFFRGKLLLVAAETSPGVADLLPVDVCLGAAVEGAGDRLCGGGIPTAILAQGRLPREEARAWLAGSGRRFLATDWEVPATTPPEVMLDISRLAEEVVSGR